MNALRKQSGIALLEAMLAVVLLGIGLIGAIGIQARAYTALSEATMRSEATLASESLVGIMANDQSNAANYVKAGAAIPPALAAWHADTLKVIPNADITVAVTTTTTPSTAQGAVGIFNNRHRVDITISWVRKAGDQASKHMLVAYLADPS
ncbi:MAG: hypothetical protein V4631_14225 [Pseudomonadota bacterium]